MTNREPVLWSVVYEREDGGYDHVLGAIVEDDPAHLLVERQDAERSTQRVDKQRFYNVRMAVKRGVAVKR